MIHKSLFGKQESAGIHWNQTRNQGIKQTLLHDSKSHQQELIYSARLFGYCPVWNRVWPCVKLMLDRYTTFVPFLMKIL